MSSTEPIRFLQLEVKRLKEENSELRAVLADYRDGRHAQQQAAAQSAD